MIKKCLIKTLSLALCFSSVFGVSAFASTPVSPDVAALSSDVSVKTNTSVKLDGVEIGKNENGTYYKFDNGILICMQKKVYVDKTWSVNTSFKYNVWTFPMEFYEEPTISFGLFGSSTPTRYRYLDTKSVHLETTTYAAATDVTAIGTWKDVFAESEIEKPNESVK